MKEKADAQNASAEKGKAIRGFVLAFGFWVVEEQGEECAEEDHKIRDVEHQRFPSAGGLGETEHIRDAALFQAVIDIASRSCEQEGDAAFGRAILLAETVEQDGEIYPEGGTGQRLDQLGVAAEGAAGKTVILNMLKFYETIRSGELICPGPAF